MWLLPLPRVPVGGLVHPLSLLALLAVIAYYAIESSIIVGWLAIRPAPPPVTGMLRVQLAIKSDLPPYSKGSQNGWKDLVTFSKEWGDPIITSLFGIT